MSESPCLTLRSWGEDIDRLILMCMGEPAALDGASGLDCNSGTDTAGGEEIRATVTSATFADSLILGDR